MGPSSRTLTSVRILEDRANIVFPLLLAGFVLVSRVLCRGPLYFGDGPSHVASIADKSYIIQPPGYWLFNRIAGLFADPVLAISVMNILFSVAGVVVFYYAARFFTKPLGAFAAAFAYGTIFYAWFSGEIHCTYASQLFFPVATFYLFLRYDHEKTARLLWIAALVYAIGTGFRPSDGVFLVPLVLYFAIFRIPRKERFIFLSLIPLFCLSWIIPTWIAFRQYGDGGVQGFATYVSYITRVQSVLSGVRMYTLANPVRYLLPLLVGFWPVLGLAVRNAIRMWSDWRVKALILWIVPGSLFFIVILISDAPYLNFLSAAILLLAIAGPRPASRWMTVTALWNAVVFLALGPIPSQKLPVNIVNSYVLRTTRGAIKQRYTLKLSQMQHLDNAK
jgi:4-amino-4-deoxy-L-arabinose transferase-like glycosyltransferase